MAPQCHLRTLRYTWLFNQACIKLYVAFGSAAIILWSTAMLREGGFGRALGVYSNVTGLVLLAGILTGVLGLGIHGFGAVVLAQGIWMMWVAVRLWRA